MIGDSQWLGRTCFPNLHKVTVLDSRTADTETTSTHRWQTGEIQCWKTS